MKTEPIIKDLQLAIPGGRKMANDDRTINNFGNRSCTSVTRNSDRLLRNVRELGRLTKQSTANIL